MAAVTAALDNFHDIVYELSHRSHNRPPLLIESEYDVQDLVFTMLKGSLPDLVREEATPHTANTALRIDMFSRASGIAIETKRVRDAAHAHGLTREIREDLEAYAAHGDCSVEVFFVYDPSHHLPNARQFERDLSAPRMLGDKEYDVIVMVRPQ
jgi:hypothetical protein